MKRDNLPIQPTESLSITESRQFVIDTAKANIARVIEDKSYVAQAKQVNASLASLVAMERNAVMLEVTRRQHGGRSPTIDVPSVPKLPPG